MNGLAIGDLFEVVERHLVLGFDPVASVGGVGVLQPAVRVGNLDAVVVVDLVDGLGMGLGQGRSRGIVGGEQSHGESEKGTGEQEHEHSWTGEMHEKPLGGKCRSRRKV